MYAGVEFEKKGCAVVPMTWIQNSNNCYWPNTCKNQKEFRNMVEAMFPPLPKWNLYPVKIHFTCDRLDDAELRLNDIIESSTNSEMHSENTGPALHLQDFEDKEGENEQDQGCYKGNNEQTSASEKSVSDNDRNSSEINNKRKSHLRLETVTRETNCYTAYNKTLSSSEWSESDDATHLSQLSSKTQDHSSVKKKLKRNNRASSPEWSPSENDMHSSQLNNNRSEGMKRKTISLASVSKKRQNRQKSSSDSEDCSKIIPKNRHVTKIINSINDQRFDFQKSSATTDANLLLQTAISVNSNLGDDRNHGILTPNNSSRFSPSSYSSLTPSRMSPNFLNTNDRAFKERVIASLEKVIAVQDQLCMKVNEISRTLENNNTNTQHLSRPDDFPNLPLEKREHFKELEKILINDKSKFNYLKHRLAVIGGPNVRAGTMNMMKFILTNKLGMKFNWAGNNNKKAFKKTSLMEVVKEAVYLNFSTDEKKNRPSDLNDLNIVRAMQDWLRLAAQRQNNSEKKSIF